MQLQLNTGNILNLSYVPITNDVFQNLTGSGTLLLGPFEVNKSSPQSFLNIILDFNFTQNFFPQGFFTNITVKLIRNGNTAEPILENLYVVTPDTGSTNIYNQYLDKNFPPGTSIEGSPIEYQVEIDYDILPNIQASFSINSISFSEESQVTRLIPDVLII